MLLKLSLKLMTIIRTDSLDSERELIDDVINKIHRAGLIVLLIDFKALIRVQSSIAVYWKRLIR